MRLPTADGREKCGEASRPPRVPSHRARCLCRLRDLAFLRQCSALRSLDVSRNRVTALHGLSALPVLQTLMASDNVIAAFPDQLPCVLLREIWLNGNR